MISTVTISGDLGSGKSTVAKLLAEQLGVPYLSTGGLQREIATRRGMTSLELNKIAEVDKSIDFEIDALTAEIDKQGRAVVVDSRMAWHFIPSSLRVYLIVDEVVGAQRILGAARNSEVKYRNVDEALQANRERRKSELLRFKDLYAVDLQDWNNFDVVVNSTLVSPETVAALIVEQVKAGLSRGRGPKYFTAPQACFPTRAEDLRSSERASAEQCALIDVRGVDFIWRAPSAVRAAIANGQQLLAASVVATREQDLLPDGSSVTSLLANLPPLAVLHEWEATLGFQFYRYPACFGEEE